MEPKPIWITLAALACLGIYLLVSAPPPLEDRSARQARIPVAALFEILEAENDAVRSLWAREFVGEGKKNGLQFSEHWRDADLEAGPLPAQFLRETAKSLEKNPSPLSLFLGSDYPINPANRFEGAQREFFRALRQSRKPQFFFMADTGLQVGMFEDVAVSESCVQCHNRHEQTPKNDWTLNDIMGATTWMYPETTVTMEELIETVAALQQGFDEAYAAYLEKAKTFRNPPGIGEHWPHEGYYLPDAATFRAGVLSRTAALTFRALTALTATARAKSPEVFHAASN